MDSDTGTYPAVVNATDPALDIEPLVCKGFWDGRRSGANPITVDGDAEVDVLALFPNNRPSRSGDDRRDDRLDTVRRERAGNLDNQAGRRPEGRRLAVKDLFDTEGVRTTYGSAVFAEHVPDRTAAAVRALEAAGWVNAGKANLHEFAYGITSQNPHYGDVPNPRFPGRVAGGSSGGCAAAVAAGEADLGLGTDTGGSIRIPAACCELAGFKPTLRPGGDGGLLPARARASITPGRSRPTSPAAPTRWTRSPGVEPAGARRARRCSRSGVAWLDHADADVRALVEAAAGLLPQRRALELPLPDGRDPAFQREIADVHRALFAGQARSTGANVRTQDRGGARGLATASTRRARSGPSVYRQRFAAALSEVVV